MEKWKQESVAVARNKKKEKNIYAKWVRQFNFFSTTSFEYDNSGYSENSSRTKAERDRNIHHIIIDDDEHCDVHIVKTRDLLFQQSRV